MNHRFFGSKPRPLVLGHRGAPWLHQENSLAGLRRALQLGADGVEFDVFLSRDRRLVVFHDEELERLTGQRGRIADLTWDEIAKLRLQRQISMGRNAAGEEIVLRFDRQEPIPLLEEVLSELKGRAAIDIELKPSMPCQAEEEVGRLTAELVDRMGMSDQVVITGFDWFKLQAARRAHARLCTGYTYDDNALDPWQSWLDHLPGLGRRSEQIVNWIAESNAIGHWIGASAINVEVTLIDDDTVEKYRERGMAVGVYTLFPLDQSTVKGPRPEAQEAASALALAARGVDWFETDDPSKLLDILSR